MVSTPELAKSPPIRGEDGHVAAVAHVLVVVPDRCCWRRCIATSAARQATMEGGHRGAPRDTCAGAAPRAFAAGNVDDQYTRLTTLGMILGKPPPTHAWGRWSVWARDPAGTLVTVSTIVTGKGDQPFMTADVAKTIVRRYFHRLLTERDVAVCYELLAPEYVDHDAPPDTPPGPESTIAFVTAFLDDYPDLSVQVADILAEANKVAARIIWQGTHGQSGAPLHQMGVVLLQLNDQGQIVERWSGYSTIMPT